MSKKEMVYDIVKKKWFEVKRGVGSIEVNLTILINTTPGSACGGTNCDPNPASGTVSNNGTANLTNVVVTSLNMGVVHGPISLAPGESANFSYCLTGASDPNPDTVTATGTYSGGTVTDSASDEAQWVCD